MEWDVTLLWIIAKCMIMDIRVCAYCASRIICIMIVLKLVWIPRLMVLISKLSFIITVHPLIFINIPA